jgi:hypothetical protein
MGKNQAYKAMQRARLGSSSGGHEEIEDGMVCPVSYYSLNSHLQFSVFYYYIACCLVIFVLKFCSLL